MSQVTYCSGLASVVVLRFCFFVVFHPSRECFTHMETSPIASEGLQNLTYDWHLWPLNSEGSLTCHIYCETGHPSMMVIFEDPWHSHLLLSAYQWSCHCLFFDIGLSQMGIEHLSFHLRGERSNQLRHNCGFCFDCRSFTSWKRIGLIFTFSI